MTTETPTSPEFRAQAIRLRRAEIAATLAEWRRDWYVDGVSRPIGDRVTLEAEDAALALEARLISGAATEAKRVRRIAQNASLLNHVTRLLVERGMGHLIEEAKALAESAPTTQEEPHHAPS